MDEDIRREPTSEEALLLGIVFEVYLERGIWPIWQHIEGEMIRRHDLEAQPILAEMPRVDARGGYGWLRSENGNTTWPNPEEKVRLTVCGLDRLESGRTAAHDFVRVVSYLADRRRTVQTDPEVLQQVLVTHEELQRDLRERHKHERNWWRPQPDELDRLARLIDREPATWNCSVQWVDPGGFEITVVPLISRYRGVSTVEEYLDRLIADLAPPRPASTQSYPHALALPEAIDYLNASWRIRAGAPLIRIRRAEAVTRLAFSCENGEQFDAQLSGLCLLLDSLHVPDSTGSKLSDLDQYLKANLPEGNYMRAHDAIATFRALFTIRAWRQHSADNRDWRSATQRLGVTLPTNNWDPVWAQIRAEAINALAQLREEAEFLSES